MVGSLGQSRDITECCLSVQSKGGGNFQSSGKSKVWPIGLLDLRRDKGVAHQLESAASNEQGNESKGPACLRLVVLHQQLAAF